MNVQLLRRARNNSALLSLFFIMTTIQQAMSSIPLIAVIGILATVGTVTDVLSFNSELKKAKGEA